MGHSVSVTVNRHYYLSNVNRVSVCLVVCLSVFATVCMITQHETVDIETLKIGV